MVVCNLLDVCWSMCVGRCLLFVGWCRPSSSFLVVMCFLSCVVCVCLLLFVVRCVRCVSSACWLLLGTCCRLLVALLFAACGCYFVLGCVVRWCCSVCVGCCWLLVMLLFFIGCWCTLFDVFCVAFVDCGVLLDVYARCVLSVVCCCCLLLDVCCRLLVFADCCCWQLLFVVCG